MTDYRLYLVTDPVFHRGYSVLEQVELALRGGVRIVQIRDKDARSEDYALLVTKALALVRTYDAFLIVNDNPHVVVETGAHGLHIGQEDMPLREARTIVGNDVIIGVSVKTSEEAILAQEGGADYVALNGVFPTSTKEDLGFCPGLDGVARIRRCTSIPVVAIGGITPGNCRAVIEAGADGVAVVTAITMADDIPRTCRSFFEILEGARDRSGSEKADTGNARPLRRRP